MAAVLEEDTEGRASCPSGCVYTHQAGEGSLDTWCKKEKPPGLVKS